MCNAPVLVASESLLVGASNPDVHLGSIIQVTLGMNRVIRHEACHKQSLDPTNSPLYKRHDGYLSIAWPRPHKM